MRERRCRAVWRARGAPPSLPDNRSGRRPPVPPHRGPRALTRSRSGGLQVKRSATHGVRAEFEVVAGVARGGRPAGTDAASRACAARSLEACE